MEVKVIVATHKEYQMPSDEMYLPVHVGSCGKESIGYQRDDVGDNISDLNPFFCELTGLYWAWKNLDADYLGLVHYRRHFSLKPRKKDKWTYILKKIDIEEKLGIIKAFVPKKRCYYIETLYSHYAHTHYSSQLDKTREIIEEIYPSYLDSFDLTVNRRWGYMFNMMILKRPEFDNYCSWLFDILLELRRRIGKEEEERLDRFQKRFYGRISEIIFNTWLYEQIKEGNIKKSEVEELPFVHMEKIDWGKKVGAFLRAKFIGKKYSSSF